MDQVKVYLAVLKKYHFWVISGLLVIVGLIGWKMGVGVLEEQFTMNRGQIQGAFQQAGGVMAVNPHPNIRFTEKLDKEHDAVKREVLLAWQLHYDRQQEIMVWPREMLTDRLVAAIEILEPRGKLLPDLCSDFENKAYRIPESWEEKYNLMRPVLDENDDEDDDENKNKDTTYTGVVVWEGLEELPDRYHWGYAPRTDEILLAQEDLWVYETLLKIVEATNNGATEHYLAPIRQIVSFDIAQEAEQAPEITIEGALNEGQRSSKEAQSSQSDSPPTKGADATELVKGRYIDEVSGRPLPNGPKPGAVYNLMPIRMRLLMDQRYITQLCVACGNSPVMVEPRQVLFVDEEGEGVKGGGGGGGGDGNMPLQPGPNACLVDLRGVIYIFNKPDEKQLQTSDTGDTPVATTGASGSGA